MNREQAKLLAPIICALAAGSAIQLKSKTGTGATFLLDKPDVDMHFDSLGKHWEASIAPKPPKQKFARIALCNLENLTPNNCVDFPCHQIQSRTPSDGVNWSPVEVIIRKGHCKDFEQHPTFVKWLSAEFPLTTQHT